MEFRRSSSFDENQSREGRPREHQDRTRFLRPDRGRSAPPDRQKEHTIAIASKDTFETLETQCMQLINNFERLSKKIQPNIDPNSFNDGMIYAALVQSYTLYQHSRYAFDMAEHNKDLPTSHREQLRLNDDRLNKIKNEARKTLDTLDDPYFIDNVNAYNENFLNDAKARMQHIKALDDFLKDIKKNITEGKSLNEEQSRTYDNLTKTSRMITPDTTEHLDEDYNNKDQQNIMDQEIQHINSISSEIDLLVRAIRINHPTLSDLTAQRGTISQLYESVREEYESRIQSNVSSQKLGAAETDHLVEARPDAPSLTNDQHSQAPLPQKSETIEHNHTPSNSEKHQLSCLVYFIQEYNIMEKNFYRDKDEKTLELYEKLLLKHHSTMIQKHEETFEPFLRYCMSWAQERGAPKEKDIIPFLAPQKDPG